MSLKKVQLPYGDIPLGSIKDPNVREVLLKMGENIRRLAQALSEAQDAINALS